MEQSSSHFGTGSASEVVAFHMPAACEVQLRLQKIKVAFSGIERKKTNPKHQTTKDQIQLR